MSNGAGNEKGVTLIELVITLLVLAFMVTIAMPSFQGMFERRRITGAAEHVHNQLRLARTEAIKRSAPVHASFSADGSATWSFGISDDVDTNNNPVICDGTAGLGDANDCTLDINGTDVLEVSSSADYPNVDMALSGATSTTFDSTRGTAGALIVIRSTDSYQARVFTTLLGRVELCTPDGSAWGMPTC